MKSGMENTCNTMHLKKYFLAILVTGVAGRDDEQDTRNHMPRGTLLDHVTNQDSFLDSPMYCNPLNE